MEGRGRMLERWDEVEVDLRVEVTLALDAGVPPRPMLVAFAGERPVAVAGLRRFDDGDALSALVEVLALLLPLGADRLAVALPGLARVPTDAGATSEVTDGQLSVLLATVVDDGGRILLDAHLHPLQRRGQQWHWLADTLEVDAGGFALTEALATLLEGRASVSALDPRDGELHRQLARCLLLGHTVALSDEVADELEPDRLAAGARGGW